MSEPVTPKVLEDFYPCPVCLGIPLSKIRFKNRAGGELILDACKRCGGIWFDHNEVHLLRQMPADLLNEQVTLRDSDYYMACHQCHQLMPRNADKCPHCRHPNILDCPVCHKAMKTREYAGLKLDICKACEGVWFDNIELAQIWNLQHPQLPGGKVHAVSDVFRDTKQYHYYHPADDLMTYWIALEVIEASPAIALGMAQAAGALAETTGAFLANAPETLLSAPELLGNAAEASGAVLEGLAETSGSIFEFIADIIGGIFDGF